MFYTNVRNQPSSYLWSVSLICVTSRFSVCKSRETMHLIYSTEKKKKKKKLRNLLNLWFRMDGTGWAWRKQIVNTWASKSVKPPSSPGRQASTDSPSLKMTARNHGYSFSQWFHRLNDMNTLSTRTCNQKDVVKMDNGLWIWYRMSIGLL